MNIYIQGSSCISPQPSFLSEGLSGAPVNHETPWLKCIEPVYREHINPTLARRLSRYIKMGVTTALTALKDAGLEMPGAIITGTGLGSTEDNEKILMAIYENQERLINPTHFIQSTHNTISSQIAIMLTCHNYNNTYVHRGFSFESALLDGMLLLREGSAETALVGGVDALTEGHYVNFARVNRWKANTSGSLRMISEAGPGEIPGEGSAHFVLSTNPGHSPYAVLRDLKLIYKPTGVSEVAEQCRQLLQEQGLTPADLQMIVTGNNGNSATDGYYDDFVQTLFPHTPRGYFKHLCGEYDTAGSFGLWITACMLKQGRIPEGMLCPGPAPEALKHVLLYNHHRGDQHSLFLLSREV